MKLKGWKQYHVCTKKNDDKQKLPNSFGFPDQIRCQIGILKIQRDCREKERDNPNNCNNSTTSFCITITDIQIHLIQVCGQSVIFVTFKTIFFFQVWNKSIWLARLFNYKRKREPKDEIWMTNAHFKWFSREKKYLKSISFFFVKSVWSGIV